MLLTNCHGRDSVRSISGWHKGLNDSKASNDIAASPNADQDVISIDIGVLGGFINSV
jgi:hypothetical protein